MGAGASISDYDQSGCAEKATATATAKLEAIGIDSDCDDGKLIMQQFGALATFKNLMDEFQTDSEGNPDLYQPSFPGGEEAIKAIKEGKEGDALAAAEKALSSWTGPYRFMNGVHLLEKNHDQIYDLFYALGPSDKGLQRKHLVAKMTEAGVVRKNIKEAHGDKATDAAIASNIKYQVDQMMKTIGKEKSQFNLGEAMYHDALTKLVTAEGHPDNYDVVNWAIKDESLTPVAVAVKKDLDSLDMRGEFGISFYEWFLYFVEMYSRYPEADVQRMIDGYSKNFGV